ncbi:protein Abitram-like [Babylonia areolata]|uniref:protein Abitram-like n=1 Tax=Babylonia areolata TaxID=304850 RepID=UPI003FD4B65F
MAQPMCEQSVESEMETKQDQSQLPTEASNKTMSYDVSKRPPTVVERYFSRHYRIDVQKKVSEDICILSHSNKICIVTLAPSHPVLAKRKVVTHVNFKVGGADRLDNKTSGKSKRGAQWLGSLAPLCTLTCDDNSKYSICCGVKGQLIEANSTLVDRPQLVNEDPWSRGYLGIMLPALKGHEAEMARLLTEEQYQEALKARTATSTAGYGAGHGDVGAGDGAVDGGNAGDNGGDAAT